MQRTAVLTPQSGSFAPRPRWVAWLRRAWDRFTMDADERYLSEARDLVELEHRQRQLERGRSGRFSPLDPDA